jgi:SAM-dependent methyltransferase
MLPDVTGWLAEPLGDGSLFLDLGCGPGALLAAASYHHRTGVGVDASMTWLLVAKRRIEAWGGTPVLACAFAERLPLGAASVDAVVSLDVIEHVQDSDAYLQEIERVSSEGAWLALSTPNRFSLTPEPHVGVWGVGWLPRPLQAGYVRRRTGLDYAGTVLMSSFGLHDAVKRNTSFACRVLIPPVAQDEMRHFSRLKAGLARIYNRVHRNTQAYWFFRLFAPFFRLVGRKAGP